MQEGQSSSTGAAKPDMAAAFYDAFNQKLVQKYCSDGIFRADMQVELSNDGPVTTFLIRVQA